MQSLGLDIIIYAENVIKTDEASNERSFNLGFSMFIAQKSLICLQGISRVKASKKPAKYNI